MTPHSALRRLETLRLEVGSEMARAKREALVLLSRARLNSSRDVLRCHEAACFARAYPGDPRVLAAASHVLRAFERRADLRRHATALADSGIAGTPIRYRFFWPMAVWLASRYPRRLTIDWTDGEFENRLGAALPLLVTAAEAEALKRAELPPRQAIDRLRARRETDAVFLLRRLAALPGGDRVREATHDAIDVAYVLSPGPDGPSRTRALFDGAPRAFRRTPFDRGRPDLARELRRPPRSVRMLSVRDGARAIALAREAMVTRSRDLDAFAHASARDVRLVDDAEGLAFVLIGTVPERRLFLPAVYGALTLRNGVPIGYVQLDVLFRNAEVSYNTFATFRGAEAGFVFGRLLAATHHIFGASSFSVEPYQLGRGNEEGLASGAWWFYARCGFRPREAGIARLARAELARRSRSSAYRSSRRMLERLASAHLYWDAPGAERGTVTPIAGIGLAVAQRLAAGADRESAIEACGERVARRLGVRSMRDFTAGERLWWRRWSPMLDALSGLPRWSNADRAAVVRVVRAKGGVRESEFASLFDAHPRLSRAILALA
jgi:hypothetical protein